MPRDIPVGNGSLLIAFDKDYVLRELYFPHVGLEDHTLGHPFRFAIWADHQFSEMGPEWQKDMRYFDDTLITQVKAVNARLGLELTCYDFVDFHLNIYLRKIVVKNLKQENRDVRLFFSHDFHIAGNEVGDTALYDPKTKALIHYKNQRYFLINYCTAGVYGVEHFSCGLKETQGFEGTWRDAEDGVLSGNAVAQGSVDSTAGVTLALASGEETTVYYWIAAGTSYQEVTGLDHVVRAKTPQELFKRTHNYWDLWISKELCSGGQLLPPKVNDLLNRSLLVMRTQIDNGGAIIAANDTDIFAFSRDTYSYMWPRDGAFVAAAFAAAGYSTITSRFFNFCAGLLEPEGYFFHKFSPDGSVGSTWHPWWKDGTRELPIQEDETALVIWALWRHFQRFHDVEFIKPLYRSLIIRAAEFMVAYRDEKTKLPKPSYDLWEEKRGVHSFTIGATFGGLVAAARFADAFGEKELGDKYRAVAGEIKEAARKYLFHKGLNRFAKSAYPSKGEQTLDTTVDASISGLWYFGAFEADDPMMVSTMQAIRDKLWVKTEVGGLSRYENDSYQRVEYNENVQGNPWFVCTLWWAQYLIACAKTQEDLKEPLRILEWVTDHALDSGILAEQVHPRTHAPLSVSPLTWSHAAFVLTVFDYVERKKQIG
jgi:glucoamylase